MGWWRQTLDGRSLACEGELKWGDGPADIMEPALNSIFRQFQQSYERNPTAEELKAGIMFSARPMLEREKEKE